MKIDRSSYIPIHEQLEGLILEDIKAKKQQPGDKLDSVRVLSAKYELCLATVQKSINSLTRKGILESKRGKGLFIAEKGKADKNDSSKKTVALISSYDVDDLQTMAYSSDFLMGTISELEKFKYDLLYVTPRNDGTGKNVVHLSEIKEREKDFAGIITLVYDEKYLYSMKALDSPVVVADYDMTYADLDSVVFENRIVAAEITEKMVKKGAEYILYLGYAHDFVNGKAVIEDEAVWERHAGVKQVIREHALPEFENQFIKVHKKTPVSEIVDTIAAMDKIPDAIIAGDILAYHIAEGLSKNTLTSDKKIIFGGFSSEKNSNINPEKYLSYNVMADGIAMGREAVRLLINRLKSPEHLAKKITIPIKLIEY